MRCASAAMERVSSEEMRLNMFLQCGGKCLLTLTIGLHTDAERGADAVSVFRSERDPRCKSSRASTDQDSSRPAPFSYYSSLM